VGAPVLRSRGPSETRRLGARLGRLLKAGDVVLLMGDLGTGKTVLAQGIGEGLEVRDPVKSSSFVLVNEYRGRLTMYHADLYRLEDPSQVAELALEENSAHGVLVVEWPDRAWEEMPPEHLLVHLDWADSRGREIALRPQGGRYEDLTGRLTRRRRR
jgi:tRNA threonylcarbamoyladenosine biosynthesis protein TsaE